MKVAVDARLLRGGGIGRYLREITGRWLAGGAVEEIRFLGSPRELDLWLQDRPERARARIHSWNDPPYSLSAQARWVRSCSAWTDGCDAIFFPHWDAPIVRRGPPRLLVVHDLIHFLEPGGFPAWKRLAGRALLGRGVRLASRIVTVSEASRKDLASWFPEAAGGVRVIPNGVDHVRFRPLSEEERGSALDRWGDLGPFLLYVGPLKPHKGVATALRTMRGLREAWPQLRLVQVGPVEVRDPEVRRLLQEEEIADRFVQLGVRNDAELNQLYGISECLLHPALREGFGLPPLEAMAVGTPVVASNRSSLPEVVGGGGTLLDPDDVEGWVRAVKEVLGDSELRETAIRRGWERAARYSWDRTAEETLEVIEEAASAGSPSSTTGS